MCICTYTLLLFLPFTIHACVYMDTYTVSIPTITTDPMDMCVPTGTSFTLTVEPTSRSLSYQWYVGTPPSGTALEDGTEEGVTISGAMTASLTVEGLTVDVMIYVVVTNEAGEVTSAAATITICKHD